ncbi:Lipocalin-related protein and Bos/Can/Equ allergen [Neorhizobium galegae bv. officinalis bv. officinalis str. HAMBI 1141]|uniref:Lipocalin-related protein and Bos/Can/Equ allergen n=1 Tax=Neorhizobium galegae bv. officinalis bv. officinalis str. HAMBI 1141 TaxID=1028801 RepID=A0A068T4K4_NEOGA|nr:AI-2E family transporter [Neorhizobium galegae]CDN53427.1 Lipocalin-related protein and Bos/Can/Equ allergen [Neorhizobium galegae bv. officinalis bv. officinalis str. HAMBI 1141]
MAYHISGASLKRYIFFWVGVLIVFVVFLWFFRSILLPFVAGMALAYFLDPVADWLERRGLSRLMATVVILVCFVLVFALSLMLVIPIIINQFTEFAAALPGYISQLQQIISSPESSFLPHWISAQIETVKQNFSEVLSQGAGFVGSLLAQIWNSGKAIIDVVSLLIVTPVVAFYILLDWDRMVAKVDSWVPRDQVATVREIAREMDESVAGFIRGQGSLCLILGIFYAVGLSVVGLNFGLLIGFVAGMISFIPYIGSLIGLVLSVGVALVQFWPDYPWILAVAGVFFVGQFIEGNILQPKLVGESVGLHPVWLMFALFAFGAIFGFVGLLIAVPAAAVVGVLVRFVLSRYLDSDIYYGRAAALPWEEAEPPHVLEHAENGAEITAPNDPHAPDDPQTNDSQKSI